MRLSLKAKQVAGVMTIVGVSMVGLSLIHVASLARQSLHESRSRGELLAHAIFQRAREVVPGAADPYAALRADPGVRSILESSIGYSRNVTYAAIVDPVGIAVAHSSPALEGGPLQPQSDLDALLRDGVLVQLRAVYSDRTFEVRQPLLLGQRQFGSIHIGVSTLLVRHELQQALRPAVATTLVVLLVALLGAMLLSQWMLRPIHVIRSGLSRLGRGEFEVQLDLPPDEEFGDLEASFGKISERLSAARDADTTLKYSKKLAAFGRLLAGVAHEVRNPLNAMTIHLELLKQKLLGSAGGIQRASRPVVGAPAQALPAAAGRAARHLSAADAAAAGGMDDEGPGRRTVDLTAAVKHLTVITEEIQRLDQVVQGFLKFTRPEELRPQPIAVPVLIDEVVRVVEPEAHNARATIETDCPADVPQIAGDPAMLRQALLNLALNACQAMPAGGHLRLACRPATDRRVEIVVQDTGVGIKPEHLGKIFDLYFTTKERGSGIGLSMAYRVVQLHDGEIEVESTVGKGTTFRVLLPQATD